MRIAWMILVGSLSALAWSVSAQPLADAAAAPYLAQLDEQCPQAQLQYLSAGDLRDGLDDFVAGQSADAQSQIRSAEHAQCSSLTAGAACVNLADIGAADRLGLTEKLATSICLDFLRCRGPGDCDHAR